MIDESHDNPGGRTGGFAFCPDSHPKVLGGGVRIDAQNIDIEVASTHARFDPTTQDPDMWVAQANDNSGHDSSMTTTVICGRGNFEYPDDFNEASQGCGGPCPVQGVVECPGTTRITGGGIHTSGDHFDEVSSTRPVDGSDRNSKPDDAWLGEASQGSMRVQAVCAHRGRFRYVHTARLPLPGGAQRRASVTCPAHTELTGGGVDISGHSSALEVSETYPAGNAWKGGAINDGPGPAETWQVFAVCRVR
ncbi:MAG: hypothetical protein U0R52_03825 [Solirubrobacterales bacterium]